VLRQPLVQEAQSILRDEPFEIPRDERRTPYTLQGSRKEIVIQPAPGPATAAFEALAPTV
jgi:hypothetical protein